MRCNASDVQEALSKRFQRCGSGTPPRGQRGPARIDEQHGGKFGGFAEDRPTQVPRPKKYAGQSESRTTRKIVSPRSRAGGMSKT